MSIRCSWFWVVLLGVVAACDGENEPPVVPLPTMHVIDEDTTLSIPVLEGVTDPDGDDLVVIGASATGAHKVDVFAGETVTLVPAKDFNGAIDVTYRVSDGAHIVSGHALVSVRPINDAPVAGAVIQQVHAPAVVRLVGTDVDGDTLSYEIVTRPEHGTLEGTPPALRYLPAVGFVGQDVIEYLVRDAALASAPAAVRLDVSPGASPVAQAGAFFGFEDSATPIVLRGTDPENNPLTYMIVDRPTHGTIEGDPPSISYVPDDNYNGPDEFTFAVSNGYASSDAARVTVFTNAVNDPPVALAQTVNVNEDGSVVITLAVSDPDSTFFTFNVNAPANGSLTSFGRERTYRPNANFNGRDSFTFTVSDNEFTSQSATVTIEVATIDDPPAAAAFTVQATEDTAASVMLRGTDADGEAVTTDIVRQPGHGTLSGTPPAMTYTPDADFSGSDTFTYTASSGGVTSAAATVTVQVAAVNDAPVASNSTVTTTEDTSVTFQLQATDVDSSLTFTVQQSPQDGTLTGGTGASRTYFPAANASGTRTFTFQASDGSRVSSATVTIEIAAVNDVPVAEDNSVFTEVGSAVTINVLANDSDADGDALTIDAVGDPAHGTAEIVDGRIAYTPAAGFTGVDTMTYEISDGHGGTDTAAAIVGVGEFPPGVPDEVPLTVGGDASASDRTPAISGDGRYVAFSSPNPLTPDDSNNALDVFVFDRVTGTTTRVSVATGGGQGNGASTRPHMSSNARYVVFESIATNLVAGDSNGASDVFRHDRTTGETARVSVATGGGQGGGASFDPEVSDDGNVVAFSSNAFDLVANDANGATDVFVRDLAAGTTTRVSVPVAGGEGDVSSLGATLSADGRFVAFSSAATNLVADDTNNVSDVFLRDRVGGTLTRISVSSTGVQADRACTAPSISRDGRFIAFLSDATNLLPGTTTGVRVYTRDTQASTTTRAGVTGGTVHARISGDGRYLAIYGGSTVVFDRFAGATVTSTVATFEWPAISSNGRYVAVIDTGATSARLRISRIPP